MQHTNELNDIGGDVYTMLEKLKSNGTFDEFRRECISDIDAKVQNTKNNKRNEPHRTNQTFNFYNSCF